MPVRASARSAATRDQASSPPKAYGDRQSQSPVAGRTRGRSASEEVAESNSGPATRRGKRKRQGSIESVENIDSTSRNNGRRSRKATGVTVASVAYPELSIVMEDQENEGPEDDEQQEEEAETDERADHLRSQSPDGMSQISGTTAITSTSAQTTHSTAELADLDPLMVEFLTDLYISSYRILDLLAPSNASVEQVEAIARDLRVLGSRRAKRLKHDEERFRMDRENFGNDHYIRTSFILQKVFGAEGPGAGSPRPDAILHTANLATLIKDLLVAQKESLATSQFLHVLDIWFPESFVSQFADEVHLGNSTLLKESFEISLEIRTQLTIVSLRVEKAREEDWDPDQVLAAQFFDPLAQRSARLTYFEDVMTNARPRALMGRAGPANSEDQKAIILKRILEIRNSFRDNNDALRAGDLVDFDQLDNKFPWMIFLTRLVQWSRWRLEEIRESMNQQGGVENIVKLLIEAIKNIDSQVEIDYDPLPSTMSMRQLLPAAGIAPVSSSRSLMDKKTVRLLELDKIRRASAIGAPSSNQTRQRATAPKMATAPLSSHRNTPTPPPGPSRQRATGPSEASEEPQQAVEGWRTIMDDIDEDPVDEEVGRSTSDYRLVWDDYSGDKNKENQPVLDRDKGNTSKRRFTGRQANARKIPWVNSEETVAGPSKRKRPRQEPHEHDESEESEESEDTGFQADQRNPDPSRRTTAPTGQRRNTITQETIRREQEMAEAALQASARGDVSSGEDDDLEEDTPRPTQTQIVTVARIATARTKSLVEPQKRIPWSEADAQHLQDLIAEYGCSWALLYKMGQFEVKRDQGALRDKARNIKVVHLKSGQPLPANFDRVVLGAKEIKSVKSVVPDYDGR